MGFFGKLFEKKICDVCGEEIGLLGNRKLEDGNLCKACAKKLSPWFEERRHSTLEEIKQQLAYREENRKAVQAFNVTRTFGVSRKLYLDDDAGKFMVVQTGSIEEENPDVLEVSQVTGCNLDIRQTEHEDKRRDDEGNMVSYNPPRIWFSYDFYMIIRVNHPYFDDMTFRLNNSSVDVKPNFGSYVRSINPASNRDYMEYEQIGNEIREALLNASHEVRQKAQEAKAPPRRVTCPWCGATTTPDASGCCEYCGGSVEA